MNNYGNSDWSAHVNVSTTSKCMDKYGRSDIDI